MTNIYKITVINGTDLENKATDNGNEGIDELVARANAGDLAARDELIMANIGLVTSEAYRYHTQFLDTDDLVQEGIMGLMEAIRRYNPERGSFSTIATWYIRKFILEAIEKRESAVNISKYMKKKGEVTIVSIDAEDFKEGEDVFFTDSVEDNVLGKMGNELLMKVMDSVLSASEKRIVMYCYGFYGTYTLEEISEILGISKKRIYVLRNRALNKLKNAAPYLKDELCA